MERQPRDSSSPIQGDTFQRQLDEAVDALKNDFTSGARQMADAALSNLSDLLETAKDTADTREEVWDLAVTATEALIAARPSMNAAVMSCLLRALDAIRDKWDSDEKQGGGKGMVDQLVATARSVIEGMLRERKEAGVKLGKGFVEDVVTNSRHSDNHLTLLTLSNSSTIRASLLHLITSLTRLELTLHILESRPRCEGADLALQVVDSLPVRARSRLRIRIFPDCAIGAAVRGVNIVLLGADRIAREGDVSNKIGSFAVAAMAKKLMNARVVVISEVDKIAANSLKRTNQPLVEFHPPSELMGAWSENTKAQLGEMIDWGPVEIFGEWFEWVPARYVDAYITEKGALGTEEVKEFSTRVGRLRDIILT